MTELHNQLASLGRHAQLTPCSSAVAELLVYTGNCKAIQMCMKTVLLLLASLVVVMRSLAYSGLLSFVEQLA